MHACITIALNLTIVFVKIENFASNNCLHTFASPTPLDEILAKDVQCSETSAEPIFRFFQFLFFVIRSNLYSKFLWIRVINDCVCNSSQTWFRNINQCYPIISWLTQDSTQKEPGSGMKSTLRIFFATNLIFFSYVSDDSSKKKFDSKIFF